MSSPTQHFETLALTPESSQYDKLSYRVIQLKNGLRAVLAHDPDADVSGASVAVNVGSLCDPFDAQGLAHFLEHMLFMGNKKYPDENSFMRFVSQAGGFSNAYTDREVTSYAFTSITPQFEDGLDRFSQFFVSPLFLPDGVGREINAVHSEHQKNVTSDLWRREQMFCNTVRKEHPESYFGTGSLETLDEAPKKRGTDIRGMMIKFYKSHYSAHRMGVAIHSKLSLDRQQELVEKMFSAVPLNTALPSKIKFSPEIYDEEHAVVDYKMTTIAPVKSMMMTWHLPSTMPQYESQIANLVVSLLGFEGEGSFTDVLKSKGWIVSATSYSTETSFFTRIALAIVLTEEGFKHQREIEAVVLKYIALFANSSDDFLAQYLDEKVRLSKLLFDTRAKPDPYQNATDLAIAAFTYPLERVINGSSLIFKPDLHAFRQALKRLSPDNLHSTLCSPTFAGKHEHAVLDHHYGTEYSVATLGKTKVEQLAKLALRYPGLEVSLQDGTFDIDISTLDIGEVSLPKPNPFIPKSTDLYSDEDGGTESRTLKELLDLDEHLNKFELQNEPADLIRGIAAAARVRDVAKTRKTSDNRLPKGCSCGSLANNESKVSESEEDLSWTNPTYDGSTAKDFMISYKRDDIELWYKFDPLFHLPTANVNILFSSRISGSSALIDASMSTYIAAINNRLQTQLYAAIDAGTQFSVSWTGALQINVSGYSDVVPRVVEAILKLIQDPEFVDESAFALAKESNILRRKNWAETTSPFMLSNALSLRVDSNNDFIASEILDALYPLELSTAKSVLTTYFSAVRTVTLVHGNIPRSSAESIGEIVLENIKQIPSSWSETRFPRVVKLPIQSTTIVPFRLQNKRENNSAVKNTYYLNVTDAKTRAIQSLLNNFLGDSAFDTLRTNELLGYMVRGGVSDRMSCHTMWVLVQSLCGPAYLDGRIESWIENELRPLVEGFSDTVSDDVESSTVTFPTLKNSTILKYKAIAISRDDITGRYSSAIHSGRYDFDSTYRIIEALEALTAEDVKQYLREYVYYDSPQRRKLSVQMYSHSIPFLDTSKPYDYPSDDANRLKAASMSQAGGTEDEDGEEGMEEDADENIEIPEPEPSEEPCELPVAASTEALKQPPAIVGDVQFLSATEAFSLRHTNELFPYSLL